MIIPIGALVNFLSIALGSILGLLFGNLITEKIQKAIFQAFGFCVLVIGFQMTLKGGDFLVIVISTALGAIVGELLEIDKHINGFGDWLRNRFKSKNPKFTEGFVSATTIVCVGSMAVVGSFQDGLGEGRYILYTKSALDFFGVLVLAASYGGGVFFSSIAVLIYEGTLTLLAAYIKPLLSIAMEESIQGCGGILVVGIGCKFLGLNIVALPNLLPALVIAPCVSWIFSLFAG